MNVHLLLSLLIVNCVVVFLEILNSFQHWTMA